MADQANAGSPGTSAGQGEGDAPKYVTAEDFDKKLNAAISGRLKDFEKKQEKAFADFASKLDPDALVSKITESLKTTSNANANDAGKGPDFKIEDHPSFRGQQKKIDEQAKLLEQIKAERDAEKARTRDTTLRQKLTEGLASAGVPADRVKHAVGFLVDVDKRVRYADDGDELVFRDNDNTVVDFNSGLKAWAKSDDAKIYLPPRGTAGSGDRPGGKSPNSQGNGAPDREELGQRLMNVLNL